MNKQLCVSTTFQPEQPKHAFILIGSPLSNEAVLCDPHEHQAYPLKDFFPRDDENCYPSARRYGNKLTIKLMLECSGQYNENKTEIKNYSPLLANSLLKHSYNEKNVQEASLCPPRP